jgi:hypothetical protein
MKNRMKEVENVKIIVRDIIIATLGGVHLESILMLRLLHGKHALQSGILVPTQHLL